MRHIRTVTMGGCVLAIVAAAAQAQTGQRYSVQGSVLYQGLYGSAYDGMSGGGGAEAQFRVTTPAWSVGAGLQYTTHSNIFLNSRSSDVQLLGFFVEPRYVFDVGSDRFAPYVSSRLAYSRMTLAAGGWTDDNGSWVSETMSPPSGPTINGGGGVLIKVSGRANLDVGATYGYTRFNDSEVTDTYSATQQRNVYPVRFGSGTNLVLRVGFAYGLGK